MRDLLKLALVGLFMNLGTGVASAQGRADLVGQWGTTVNGQQVVLTLNADGSADLMGTQFSWQAQGNTITVSGPQGQLPGEIRGSQLIFNLSGQPYTYTRMGGGSAPPPVANGGGGGGGLAGSWTTSANGHEKGSYKKSSDKSGGSSRSTYVTIKPGSTYSRKSHVSVETAQPREDEYWRVPGASVLGTGGEEGTFMIHGPLITWMPNGGISYSNLVEWVSGGLYLDGKVWVGCS